MKIAAVYKDGEIQTKLSDNAEIMVVTVENGEPVNKEIVPMAEDEMVSVLFKLASNQVDVFIAGEVGMSIQSAMRMMGVQMILGCHGSPIDNIAGYLSGEQIGDPSKIIYPPEMDEDDPMQCMHDCSKCSGCH
ncbi:MAG: NifB/NifX family molybdenum-iron cluster-binding protein [Butyricicoccaceae bacterium]